MKFRVADDRVRPLLAWINACRGRRGLPPAPMSLPFDPELVWRVQGQRHVSYDGWALELCGWYPDPDSVVALVEALLPALRLVPGGQVNAYGARQLDDGSLVFGPGHYRWLTNPVAELALAVALAGES
jgi:hypothetical protein